MTTHKLSLAIVFAILASVSGNCVQADITYALVNHAVDQNGHTLGGLITTTDASINDGYLVASEILGWEFTISGPSSASISSTDAGSTLQLNGDILISANNITIEAPPIMSDMQNNLEMINNNGSRLSWYREEFFGSQTDIFSGSTPSNNAWNVTSPSMSNTDPWLVATRVVSIPEPSGLSLLVVFATSYVFRRRNI